jgi:hypothetical protein
MRLFAIFTLWSVITQAVCIPLVYAQENNQTTFQAKRITELTQPTPSPTPKRDSLESGFITKEDVLPYRDYENFNPSCPAVISEIREENKSIPTSLVFDWVINWWTKSDESSATSSCSIPQEEFIADCRDKGKTFYNPVMTRSGFGALPLSEFFEDYVSNRKETYLVGYNHAPPTLTTVHKCLRGANSESQNNMLTYAEYISNLIRLKRGTLLSLEQLANIDRMLSAAKELEGPVLKGISCNKPGKAITNGSDSKVTGGPTSFVEEQIWCDKLTACNIPEKDTEERLTTLIKNTIQFYKDLKFLYIQKSIYSAARTMLLNRSEKLQQTGLNTCDRYWGGVGYKDNEKGNSHFYPYNYFAEYVYEAYSNHIQNKKKQADIINDIWEEFEPDLSQEESPSMIDSSMVYQNSSGVGYKILEGEWSTANNSNREYSMFKEYYFKPEMNQCIKNFSINLSSNDKETNAFITIQKIVSELEYKIIKIILYAQANLPWVFSPEFKNIDVNSDGFYKYIFSPDLSAGEVRAIFISKFKSARRSLISALSDYRRAAKCMTSSLYKASTCTDLNDIIERIPYFNPLSLTKVDLKGSKCFIGSYGYVQGYFGSVECARQVKKYNKQYDQVRWDSTKALGFTIAMTGLSGLAMLGSLTKAALAGSNSAYLTRLGAGLAALGLDGYMGGEGFYDAYNTCKGPVEAYGVATDNIDLSDFESGPKCNLAENHIDNIVIDLKQQAGSCVGAALMSLAFDLLPIIPSIGALGAIKRANATKLEEVSRAVDVKVAPKRSLVGEDVPVSSTDHSIAPAPVINPPEVPAPRGPAVATRGVSADGDIKPAVDLPERTTRLNDPASAHHAAGAQPGFTRFGGPVVVSDVPLPAHRQGAVGDISSQIDATTDIDKLSDLRAQRGRAMDALPQELQRQARMDLADELIGFRKGKTPSQIDAIETELMRLHHEIPLPRKPDPFLPKGHPDVIAYEAALQTALRKKLKGAKAAGITDKADRELLVKNWILGSQEGDIDSIFHVPRLPNQPPHGATLPPVDATVIKLDRDLANASFENILKAHIPPHAITIREGPGGGLDIDLSQIDDLQKRQFLSGMLTQQRKTEQLSQEVEELNGALFLPGGSVPDDIRRAERALEESVRIEKEMKDAFIDRMKGEYSSPAQAVRSLKGPERQFFVTESLSDFERSAGYKSPGSAERGWKRVELSASAMVQSEGAVGKRIIYRQKNGRMSVLETYTPDGQYLSTEVIVLRNPQNPNEGHAFFAFEDGRLSDEFMIPGNHSHLSVSHGCSECHRTGPYGSTTIIPTVFQTRFLDEYIQSLQ